MVEIRKIQDVIERLTAAGAHDPDDILQKLYKEFGDIPEEDLKKAFSASAEEHDIKVRNTAAKVVALKYVKKTIELAKEISGKQGMTAGEAVEYLQSSDDTRAQALLKDLEAVRSVLGK